jgi:DNA-directed RNA polymerase specialized sigma24 family protein
VGGKKNRRGRRRSGSSTQSETGSASPSGRSKQTIPWKASLDSIRPDPVLYAIQQKHYDIILEVEKLFPELAPVVDFSRIPPGAESIETLSQELYRRLRRRFHDQLFMAFCELNSERMIGYFATVIDYGAYPLHEQEMLAELYTLLYGQLGDLASQRARLHSLLPGWKEPRADRSVYEALKDLADALMYEQVQRLKAMSVPIPGIPATKVEPGERTVENAASFLETLDCELPEDVLGQWVGHALMRLSPEHRRIIFLRDQRERTMEEIGEELGITPFEAGIRLREAMLKLRDQLARILATFGGPATRGTQDTSLSPNPKAKPEDLGDEENTED